MSDGWWYDYNSEKEVAEETKKRAALAIGWIKDTLLKEPNGNIYVISAHASYIDLLLNILLKGSSANWDI